MVYWYGLDAITGVLINGRGRQSVRVRDTQPEEESTHCCGFEDREGAVSQCPWPLEAGMGKKIILSQSLQKECILTGTLVLA